MQAPNYTQIPNEILDDWMAKLSGVEFKVVMKICRNTFGWHKGYDGISVSQLEAATGYGHSQISKAIHRLEEMQLISTVKHDGKVTTYQIRLSEPIQKVDSTQPESGKVPIQKVDTQKKVKESNKEKEKDTAFFNAVNKYFYENSKVYYPDGKEGNHIKQLQKKLKTFDVFLPLAETFKTLTESADPWWRQQPFTPSSMNSFLSSIKTAMQKPILHLMDSHQKMKAMYG